MLVATINAQALLGRDGVAQRLRNPVGAYTVLYLIVISGIFLIQRVLLGKVGRGIKPSQAFVLKLLRGRKQVVVAEVGCRQAQRTTIIKFQFSPLQGLGGDNDNTSRSLRAIQCRCRRIFKHRHGFDVVHVHVVHIVHFHLRTIHYKHGHVGLSRKRCTSTYVDIGHLVGVGTSCIVFQDVHARHKSSKTCQYVLSTHGQQFVFLDRHLRTSKAVLVLCGETCYHHFAQHIGIVVHHEVARCAVLHCFFQWLVANVVKGKFHLWLVGFYLVMSV